MVEIQVGQMQDNRVSPAHAQALLDNVTDAIERDQAVCLVPAHRGRFFCSGFDLGELRGMSESRVAHTFETFLKLTRAVFHAPVPVVTLADGHAVGFGAMLCLAADVASLNAKSKFRFPEAQLGLGLFPDIVSLIQYRSLPAVAQRLLCTAQPASAQQALQWGLLSHIHESDVPADLLESAHGSVPPYAFREMKRLCRKDFLVDDIAAQVDDFMATWSQSETQERIRRLLSS